MKNERGKSLVSFLLFGSIIVIIMVVVFFYINNIKRQTEIANAENKDSNLVKTETVEEPEKVEEIENVVDEDAIVSEEKEPQDESKDAVVINNGDYFVKYNEDVYYWKLNESSMEKTALYGNYKYLETDSNELVKRDSDGNEETIFKGNGYGKIYISNKKIYTSEQLANNNEPSIICIDLNTGKKENICLGEIKFFQEDNFDVDYLIVGTNKAEIIKINTKTNKKETLKENACYLGVLDDKIYYLSIDSKKYSSLLRLAASEVNIGVLDGNQDKGVIATFKKDIFENASETDLIDITSFRTESNIIKFELTYVGGSATVDQEKVAVSMNKDGKIINQVALDMKEGGEFINEYKEEKLVETKYIDAKSVITYNGIQIFEEDDVYQKYNLEKSRTGDYQLSFEYSSIVDDDIYFVYNYDKYSEEASIGWRDGYERVKTIVFKYNFNEKEIAEVYSF